MFRCTNSLRQSVGFLACLLMPALLSQITTAQPTDLLSGPLTQAFREVPHWHSVGQVSAVADKPEFQTDGNGPIIINGTTKDKTIPYLITREEFGDVKIELEFMVPRRSNAGVYLMGRYEVQILDSFGRERVGFGDLGGIYQRWDPTRPKAEQGFEGTKPRVNAAKAPGEWQTMEIVFRAPRFAFDGTKVKDATFETVVVNGTLVQENTTTSGPTRSSPLEGESVTGPIAIQGDHGPVAIRRYIITRLPPSEETRLKELNQYWAKVSQAVNEGDFAAYESTCHESAVIVAGSRNTSYPLANALARWKKDFDQTHAGTRKSAVEFRFSHRYGDATTAHEAGVFKYTWSDPNHPTTSDYIAFEALLTKETNRWEMLMEYQKGKSTQAAWDALENAK